MPATPLSTVNPSDSRNDSCAWADLYSLWAGSAYPHTVSDRSVTRALFSLSHWSAASFSAVLVDIDYYLSLKAD